MAIVRNLARRQPHRISVEDLTNLGWREVASATTADASQRKRLEVAVGDKSLRLSRRYLATNEDWQVVYEGYSVEEAVRLYNGLS